MTDTGGLRERKKSATRAALSAAALRLALEHGPANVRVDDIAEAAGVSPRTYNNYFASREQAIVAAVAAERALRIGAALQSRPAEEPLADAVLETLVQEYTRSTEPADEALLLITATPNLRAEFVDMVTAIEHPLASAIAARTGTDPADLATVALAAAIGAAVRVAVERWARPHHNTGLVIPTGSLADLLRTALAPLRPALAALAEQRTDGGGGLDVGVVA